MNQQINYNYEIIIVDFVGKSEITSVKSLSKALAYSEKLWHDSVIKENGADLIIEDTDLGITLQVNKIESLSKTKETTFILNVNSFNFDEIEKFREKLLVHLVSKLGFVSAVVVSDSVSEKISSNIYPLIKTVENSVRKNLTKLFLQKEGLTWWETIASKSIVEKVKNRKNVAYTFDGFVDTSACLTDFNDISELIQQAPFADTNFKSNWEKLSLIRDKVMTYSPLVLEDYLEIKQISKTILETLGEKANTNSFIKETVVETPAPVQIEYKIEDFLKPVAEVEIPSTKVVVQELTVSITQSSDSEIIEESKVAEVVINEVDSTLEEEPIVAETAPEEEAIEVPVVIQQVEEIIREREETPSVKIAEEKIAEKQTPIQGDKLISENEFIEELKNAEKVSNGTFINLKYFVATILSNGGYSTGYAYSLSKALNEKGKIELYDAKDAVGIAVRAIKTK